MPLREDERTWELPYLEKSCLLIRLPQQVIVTQSFCPVSDPAFSQTLTFLLSLTTVPLTAVPEFNTVLHTVAQVHNLGTIFCFLRIYIYLTFFAVLGLHCCVRAFSAYSEQRLLSTCTQTSHCSNFSYCSAWINREQRLQ